MEASKIGVCTWSIARHDVVRGIEYAASKLTLRVAQVGFFTEQSVRTADPIVIARASRRLGVEIISPFVAFEREDYASIERIAATGGYGFDEEYALRLELTRQAARLASALECASISAHAGTVPEDPAEAMYGKLVERVREVADLLREHDLRLLIETGREPARVLARFIDAVGRDNVGVNFDPGNFVIYGTDDPAQAVFPLKDRIDNVHMKDAAASADPGVSYGGPAALGAGDARIPRVLKDLRAAGYSGPLIIEADTRRLGMEALQNAVDYLRATLPASAR
jgi:L-ribulose-5-phosphate 3-epimerase